MLNHVNILRIIFKLIGGLYQKVFKNIILSRVLNVLMLYLFHYLFLCSHL